MNKTRSDIELLSEKQRTVAINKIIDYFEAERDEKIGVIAAEDILDTFLDTIGTAIYNKGVENSQKFLRQRHEQLLIDLEALLKKD